MGLSRNKVAVPEGAAGTPPFWSVTEIWLPGASRGTAIVRTSLRFRSVVRSVAVFPSLRGQGERPSVRGPPGPPLLFAASLLWMRHTGPQGVGSPAGREGRPRAFTRQPFIDILIQAEKLRVEQKSKSLMYIDAPPPDASAVSSRKGSDSGVKAWREEKRQEVYKGHMVDAWALGGDEGRDKLR